MTRRCRHAGEFYPDDVTFCEEHSSATVVVPTPRDAPASTPSDVPGAGSTAERRQWGHDVCWHCGKPSPSAGNPNCLNTSCRKSLTAPAVHIRFADGEVSLTRDDRTDLGRHGPHSRTFVGHGNVSRRHAVVVVNDGVATVQALHTPNGTFVNDDEMTADTYQTLRNGDRLRFASNVEGQVTLFALQPHA